MQKSGKSKIVIQDIAGCGKFQIIIGFCTFFFANTSPAFTMMFMSFGNYNPGWKCLHYNSTILSNDTLSVSDNNVMKSYNGQSDVTFSIHDNGTKNVANDSDYLFGADSCHVFESCDHVEFNPESSTIVSEWGLLCGRKWIISVIISIQMAGVLVGSLIAGHLGDAIGRKSSIYGALLVTSCLNIVSLFSTVWQMFAVVRFFLGVSIACALTLYLVFTVEFVPIRWRSFLIGLPAFACSSILFALTCLYLKNWRHIHIVTIVIGVISLIPGVWIPESLRWLEVKNKTRQFVSAADKVTRVNGKTLPSMEDLGKMSELESDLPTTSTKTYTIVDLFKKGIRKHTLLLSVPYIILSLVAYALEFGVKSLHGDFYLNLIIWNLVNIPFCIVPIILPNLLGRKRSALIFSVGSGMCLLGASCMDRLAPDSTRGVGVAVLVFIGKMCIEGQWCVMAAFKVELYPTVVRGLGSSWCLIMARLGGIIAPFLVPDDENSVFISYTTMGVLILICIVFLVRLPETKGKSLQDVLGS